MRMRAKILGTVAALVAASFVASAPAVASVSFSTTPQPAPLVVIGFSGVEWQDLSEESAPNLLGFQEGAASANVVTKTAEKVACPGDGWLTLGAGARATAGKEGNAVASAGANGNPTAGESAPAAQCPEIPVPDASGVIPGWDAIEAANRDNSYAPKLGALAGAADPGQTVALGAGAALALAENGKLSGQYQPLAPLDNSAFSSADSAGANADAGTDAGTGIVESTGQAAKLPDDPALSQLREAAPGLGNARLAVIDLGALNVNADLSGQIAMLDRRFGAALEVVREAMPDAQIMVSDVADRSTSARLGYFALAAAGALAASDRAASFAYSASTRTQGLVQLTDITPTAYALTGAIDANSLISAGKAAASTQVRAALYSDAAKVHLSQPLVPYFYLGLSALFVIVLGAGLGRIVTRRTGDGSTGFTQFMCWVAALPAATLVANALPWWTLQRPELNLLIFIALFAALIALGAVWTSGETRKAVVRAGLGKNLLGAQTDYAPGGSKHREVPRKSKRNAGDSAPHPVYNADGRAVIGGKVVFGEPGRRVPNELVARANAQSATSTPAATQPELLQRARSWIAAPFIRVGLVTVAVVVADLVQRSIMRGSSLMTGSLLGMYPITGGRFYGLTNTMFTLLAVGALILAALLARTFLHRGQRRAAVIGVVAVWAVTVALDALPFLGADFGGAPALTLGFAALAVWAGGRRFGWLAGAGALAAGVTLTAGAVAVDRLLGTTTHLGALVSTAEKGGLWTAISRKLEQLFYGLNPVAGAMLLAMLVVLILGLTWAISSGRLRGPRLPRFAAIGEVWEREPFTRSVISACAFTLIFASLTNDSGLTIACLGASIIVPSWLIGAERYIVAAQLQEMGLEA